MGVVLSERRGAAQWITINREDRRNALNTEVVDAIRGFILAAAADPAVRAIVLTGAGGKAFCAGADLQTGTGVFSLGLDEPMTDFGRLARALRELPVPIVARVNGACVAGGFGMLGLCDLAIAADHARFGLPETRVGVFPMQVLVYLRHLVGARVLNELCLTGDMIDAARAREVGLVNQVVPAADLDAAVEAMVARIAAGSPVAVRRGKYAIAAMQSMAFAEALSFAETQIAVASRTADAAEGLAAFSEKRKPRWAADE